MRANEFTREQWDHGTTSNMMDTTPTEGGFGYDKQYGRMMPKQDEPDEGPHGIYVDGKLVKTYWGREAAENVARHNPKFRGMAVEVKAIHNEDHSSQRMTNNTMPYNERAEALRSKIAALEQQLQEKASPKLCRSPKRLGRSDHSSCVAQGLRPHNSKGKGHTDGNGHYLKGHKAKSVKYGGNVKDYS